MEENDDSATWVSSEHNPLASIIFRVFSAGSTFVPTCKCPSGLTKVLSDLPYFHLVWFKLVAPSSQRTRSGPWVKQNNQAEIRIPFPPAPTFSLALSKALPLFPESSGLYKSSKSFSAVFGRKNVTPCGNCSPQSSLPFLCGSLFQPS